MRISSLTSVFASCCAVLAANTASWGTVANLGQVRINASGANSAGAPQLAFDANGDALAVWHQAEDGTNAESIWYSRYR